LSERHSNGRLSPAMVPATTTTTAAANVDYFSKFAATVIRRVANSCNGHSCNGHIAIVLKYLEGVYV
jgi:hypothetical protein